MRRIACALIAVAFGVCVVPVGTAQAQTSDAEPCKEQPQADGRLARILDWVGLNRVQSTCPIFIFIPGIMGSTIKQEGKIIWGRADPISTPNISYKKDQQVEVGPLERVTPALGGLRIPVSGSTAYDYAEPIRRLGKKIAAENGKDIELFSYDWRQDNEDTARLLSERVCQLINNRPVVFLAHSMGGIVLKTWFLKQYKNGRVRCGQQLRRIEVAQAIFIGVPQLGTPKTIRAFASGYAVALDDDSLLSPFDFLANMLNRHGATFPSAYQLLPIYGSDHECPGIKYDRSRLPPPVKLLNAPSDVKFGLFDPSIWRSLGWPMTRPDGISEDDYYLRLLPQHLIRAKSLLCELAHYQMPAEVKAVYFAGSLGHPKPDNGTDLGFDVRIRRFEQHKRGSSTLSTAASRGKTEGDGSVPLAIATYSGNRPMDQVISPLNLDHVRLLGSGDLHTHVLNLFRLMSHPQPTLPR